MFPNSNYTPNNMQSQPSVNFSPQSHVNIPPQLFHSAHPSPSSIYASRPLNFQHVPSNPNIPLLSPVRPHFQENTQIKYCDQLQSDILTSRGPVNVSRTSRDQIDSRPLFHNIEMSSNQSHMPYGNISYQPHSELTVQDIHRRHHNISPSRPQNKHHGARIIAPHSDDVQTSFPKFSNQNQCDSTFLDEWIKSSEKLCQKSSSYNLLISDIQNDLVKAASLLQILEQLQKSLNQNGGIQKEKTMDEIFTIKNILDITINKINNPEYIKTAQLKVESRRRQRKRANNSEKKILKRKMRKENSDKIDDWRAVILKKEKDAFNSKELKRNTDKVFGEVRKKQEDSKRMMDFLHKLKELREIREKKMSNAGQSVSSENSNRFNSIQDGLKFVVEDQLRFYEMEEKTLKAMMEEAPKSLSKYRSEFHKKELNSILFGSSHNYGFPSYFAEANHSVEKLINIRKLWDSFIDTKDSPMSSSIPVYWVIPPSNPSNEWKKYQCN